VGDGWLLTTTIKRRRQREGGKAAAALTDALLHFSSLFLSFFLSVPCTKPSTPAQLSPALKPLPASLNFLSAMNPFFPLN
jgi:hypothetical protein